MRKAILVLLFLAITTCVFACDKSNANNENIFETRDGWYDND